MNIKWTRPNEEKSLDGYLEALGLTQALDKFLSSEVLNDLYRTLFIGGCDGLKAKIDTMPESVKSILLKAMEGCEEAVPFFTAAAKAEFKSHIAGVMAANEYTLGDVSGVTFLYQVALEGAMQSVMDVATDIATEILEEILDSYKQEWLDIIPNIDDEEGVKAILDEALGEDSSELDDCMVVEVVMPGLMH